MDGLNVSPLSHQNPGNVVKQAKPVIGIDLNMNRESRLNSIPPLQLQQTTIDIRLQRLEAVLAVYENHFFVIDHAYHGIAGYRLAAFSNL